jgi:hypothetical protein
MVERIDDIGASLGEHRLQLRDLGWGRSRTLGPAA